MCVSINNYKIKFLVEYTQEKASLRPIRSSSVKNDTELPRLLLFIIVLLKVLLHYDDFCVYLMVHSARSLSKSTNK